MNSNVRTAASQKPDRPQRVGSCLSLRVVIPNVPEPSSSPQPDDGPQTPKSTSPLQRLLQRLPNLKHIPHDPVLLHTEDRRFRVRIHRHDGPHVLHPRQMLDGAGDAHGEVEAAVAGDFAGLADLAGLGEPAGVGDGAGATQGGAGGFGEVAELLDVGFFADAAADRQDEGDGGDLDVFAGGAGGGDSWRWQAAGHAKHVDLTILSIAASSKSQVGRVGAA